MAEQERDMLWGHRVLPSGRTVPIECEDWDGAWEPNVDEWLDPVGDLATSGTELAAAATAEDYLWP